MERRASWHRKDCSTCLYKIGHRCHRFPPSLFLLGVSEYPIIGKKMLDHTYYTYQDACAEHLDVEERAKKSSEKNCEVNKPIKKVVVKEDEYSEADYQTWMKL